MFIRQVVAELRKVIWPTRNELVTYTTVALVVHGLHDRPRASLDYGFTKLMVWVFG